MIIRTIIKQSISAAEQVCWAVWCHMIPSIPFPFKRGMTRPFNRSAGMVLNCQMATRTECKSHVIGLPPAYSSSTGISNITIPVDFSFKIHLQVKDQRGLWRPIPWPFSLEIVSLTTVRVWGPSLIGGSTTGTTTPLVSKLIAIQSTW